MCARYIIEIELTLDDDAKASALEQARQLCLSHGRFKAVGQDGQQVSEEEFIDGPEQALLELLDGNQLFKQTDIEILRLACGRVSGED
jgi:hypothetical protein